ncbi:HupE/UreJ family protein [Massilia sp. erpn]|uniref:HupE/UreJ family protein n=1 Tax=Massilia sp. erpn TaxID=2738142 RepID=UPI002107F595|nr:HupE/UreJ family protein [Massilia sp. erpn]UTY59629.1 HupE/UreJ family protein [Massilia sp. erpn]
MMRRLQCMLLLSFLLLPMSAAFAHKPSDSYLSLEVAGRQIEGQWDIALRDLDFALGLDSDGDGRLTWGEVRSQHGRIAAYAFSRLTIAGGAQPANMAPGGGLCTVSVVGQLIDHHTDGAYAVLRFHGECATAPERLTVAYRLFADTDAQHKGLLRIQQGANVQTAILGADHPQQVLYLDGGTTSRRRGFFEYMALGVQHIWAGFDHILFLISLLLPAVLVRSGHGWRQAGSLRAAAIEVCKVVTAFTLAHSLTLSLAALELVSLPSRLVEAAIAASVIVAAVNNLIPFMLRKRWVAAFGFGVIHGFGFASVLAGLGLPAGAMLLSLAGFNLGVELGQLAIVAVFLPLAYALRATWFYRRTVLQGGSAAIALLAGIWLLERALDMKLTGI